MSSEGPDAPLRRFPVTIDGEGTWLYGGRPIVHAEVLRLFKSCLHPSAKGGWELRLKSQVWPVTVEDTPCFVNAVRDEGGGRYTIGLDDGTEEPLDCDTLRTDGRGVRAQVKAGRFPARFKRAAYLDLAHLVELGPDGRFLLPVEGGGAVDLSGLES